MFGELGVVQSAAEMSAVQTAVVQSGVASHSSASGYGVWLGGFSTFTGDVSWTWTGVNVSGGSGNVTSALLTASGACAGPTPACDFPTPGQTPAALAGSSPFAITALASSNFATWGALPSATPALSLPFVCTYHFPVRIVGAAGFAAVELWPQRASFLVASEQCESRFSSGTFGQLWQPETKHSVYRMSLIWASMVSTMWPVPSEVPTALSSHMGGQKWRVVPRGQLGVGFAWSEHHSVHFVFAICVRVWPDHAQWICRHDRNDFGESLARDGFCEEECFGNCFFSQE